MTTCTVLHLIHTSGAGGAETVFRQVVDHLDPERWRSLAGVPAGGWLESGLRGGPAHVLPLPGDRPFDFGLVYRLLRWCRDQEVDLVHSHLFGPAVYGSIAAHLLGLPLVATIHGSVDLATAERWWGSKKIVLRRERNRFVAVTDALRAEIIGSLGIEPGQVEVIRNGIDIDRFRPTGRRPLRKEFGWTANEIVIGSVGNVRWPKGYDLLLEAAGKLIRRNRRCRFVIVGDTEGEPDLFSDLLRRRRELDLEGHVEFAGFRNDVNDVLNSLDIFVMSSVREGLPLSLLQAMAAGVPVVATRCGGPQEVLTHGEDGILVPVDDPDALADAVQVLVADAGQRERLRAAALTHVRRRYSITRMVAEYAEAYERSLDPVAEAS